MNTQHALLAEIAADPADDATWAVLSDWFEDENEPLLAELVRLSLRLRRHPSGLAYAAGEGRLRELHDLGVCLPLPRREIAIGERTAVELTLLPPGRFLMGSPAREARREADEGPLHPVTLSRGLWLSTYPVTQGQWQALMGGRPPGRSRGRRLPVEGVSWFDCYEFLDRLSGRHGLPFRLPTEAEWEYACRSLTTTPFFFGDALSSEQANFDGNYPYGQAAVGPWVGAPTPVGSYPPNAFGLFDMHGNVWDWCADWYGEHYYRGSPEVDPPGPSDGYLRVARGGSWYSYGWSCRSSNREHALPDSGAGHYGFRVALTA